MMKRSTKKAPQGKLRSPPLPLVELNETSGIPLYQLCWRAYGYGYLSNIQKQHMEGNINWILSNIKRTTQHTWQLEVAIQMVIHSDQMGKRLIMLVQSQAHKMVHHPHLKMTQLSWRVSIKWSNQVGS
jgi:hypothetical protein